MLKLMTLRIYAKSNSNDMFDEMLKDEFNKY
jgi:hypothetical protein